MEPLQVQPAQVDYRTGIEVRGTTMSEATTYPSPPIAVANADDPARFYLYRPNELLVASRSEPLLTDRLEGIAELAEVIPELEVVRYQFRPDMDVPAFIDELLTHDESLQVGPNHVFWISEEEEAEEGGYQRGEDQGVKYRAKEAGSEVQVADNAEADGEEQSLDGLPQIDRIILYIDDLDRCPAKRVVGLGGSPSSPRPQTLRRSSGSGFPVACALAAAPLPGSAQRRRGQRASTPGRLGILGHHPSELPREDFPDRFLYPVNGSYWIRIPLGRPVPWYEIGLRQCRRVNKEH
jgi:hypothetical protein